MKTVFTYAHVKWFLWPIRACVLFELFYNNPLNSIVNMYWVGLVNYMRFKPNWSFTHAVGFMYSL